MSTNIENVVDAAGRKRITSYEEEAREKIRSLLNLGIEKLKSNYSSSYRNELESIIIESPLNIAERVKYLNGLDDAHQYYVNKLANSRFIKVFN